MEKLRKERDGKASELEALRAMTPQTLCVFHTGTLCDPLGPAGGGGQDILYTAR